jgi:rubrerythrin
MSRLTGEGGVSGGYQRLKSHQSLGEILETAMSFEHSAHEFYTQLVDKVSKPMRALVQELANEEREHYALFQKLKDNPDVTRHISEQISTPSSDHRFSDYIHLPDLGEHPDDQTVLQYALGREHAAMEQYTALAEDTPDGPLKDAFTFLAQQELEHKRELEKRYYETVHSGGV